MVDIVLFRGIIALDTDEFIKLHKYDVLIAYPTFSALGMPALTTPTTLPFLSNIGPPLFPGCTGAEI